MTTPYTGAAANVSSKLVAGFLTASNTTPIVITTASPHGYSTGDQVQIFGCSGNLAANSPANSPWTITVTGAYTFSLNGSSGSGAGAAGTALDRSLTPYTAVASGADSPLVMNAPIQTALDRLQYLASLIPPWMLLNRYQAAGSAAYNTAWASTTIAVTHTWQTMTFGASTSDKLFSATSSPTAFATGPTAAGNLITWNPGDILEVSFTGTFGNPGAGAIDDALSLSWTDDANASTLFLGGMQIFHVLAGSETGASLRGTVTNQNRGGTATISSVVGSTVTVTNLSGMTANVVGDQLRLLGCATAGNNGTFTILSYVNATTATIYNPSGALDANSGSIVWGLYNAKFNLGVEVWGAAGDTPNLEGPYSIIVNHYRPTQDALLAYFNGY